jgi:prepilin-type N-terminal cleavage/methylation domain-containing protein
MRNVGRKAFTLVELLVVIGIIALLISILLPALAGARYQARLTVCAARLQQLAQAENIYAGDHRGKFLRVDASSNTACNGWDVSNGMYTAMREEMGLPQEVLFCPDSPEELTSQIWSAFSSDFKILGYSWWTPRSLGGIVFPPSPASVSTAGLLVFDPKSAGPERLGDRVSNEIPIITDAVITVGTLPWPAGYGQDQVWSTHRRGNLPDIQNQAFADGHVERKAVRDLTPRYARDTDRNWQWR